MSPFDRLGLFAVSLMFCALSGAVDAASVPVSAVTVTQVQNVNEPGLNPYQHFVTFNQSSAYCYNFACTVELPAVPEGRRLVITYAMARSPCRAAVPWQTLHWRPARTRTTG
jgi:hypothetical protein